MKEVVLFRHGESEGQTASRRGFSRKDPSLIDCFVTERGIGQALELRNNLEDFELVCTSPLTRAMATCCLGFGHLCTGDGENGHGATTFACHPGLAEIGSSIPENTGRPMSMVARDIKRRLKRHPHALRAVDRIDFSLLPSSWPEPSGDSIGGFLSWLFHRPESRVAVVCHHNVIQKLLNHGVDRVPNCAPIHCVIDAASKRLRLRSQEKSPCVAEGVLSSTPSCAKDRGKVRLGLCSKLEQKRPGCLLVVEPVAGAIIEGAGRKFRWQGNGKKRSKNRNSRKGRKGDEEEHDSFLIRRIADGRQCLVSKESEDVIGWLRDGDVVYVGPESRSVVAMPPARASSRPLLQEDSTFDRGDVESGFDTKQPHSRKCGDSPLTARLPLEELSERTDTTECMDIV